MEILTQRRTHPRPPCQWHGRADPPYSTSLRITAWPARGRLNGVEKWPFRFGPLEEYPRPR